MPPRKALVYLNLGFPDGALVKNPTANAGDVCSIPGSGRSPGGGHGNPLQYFCLDNPWTEEGYSPWVCKKLDMTEHTCTDGSNYVNTIVFRLSMASNNSDLSFLMILLVGWVVLLVLTSVVHVAAFSCESAGEWKIVRLGQLGLSLLL